MSRYLALLATSLLFASAAALAAPNSTAAEKKARSECWAMTRGWDINLPARACDDPNIRVLAMKRAYELCEKERMKATGALRLRRCLIADTR